MRTLGQPFLSFACPPLAVDGVGAKLEQFISRPHITTAIPGGSDLVCACIIAQLGQLRRAGVRLGKNMHFGARWRVVAISGPSGELGNETGDLNLA